VFGEVKGKKAAFYESFGKLEETGEVMQVEGVWTTRFPKQGTEAETGVPGTNGEPTE
jgi:hypothetical protein